MHELAHTFRKRSRQNANCRAYLEIGVEANRPGDFGGRHQGFDNAWGYGYRLLPHDQRGDPESAVDAPPAIPRKIQDNEDVARKKRRHNIAQFASVSNGAPHSRGETPKS